jgi:hypothetical protein
MKQSDRLFLRLERKVFGRFLRIIDIMKIGSGLPVRFWWKVSSTGVGSIKTKTGVISGVCYNYILSVDINEKESWNYWPRNGRRCFGCILSKKHLYVTLI